jgi:transcriptional regulator with XRE-family HTH domain
MPHTDYTMTTTKKATGGKVGKPIQLSGPMAPLAHAYDSVTDLAEALGVNPSTIQRWDNGTISPSATARRLLRILAKNRGLPAPFEI